MAINCKRHRLGQREDGIKVYIIIIMGAKYVAVFKSFLKASWMSFPELGRSG